MACTADIKRLLDFTLKLNLDVARSLKSDFLEEIGVQKNLVSTVFYSYYLLDVFYI